MVVREEEEPHKENEGRRSLVALLYLQVLLLQEVSSTRSPAGGLLSAALDKDPHLPHLLLVDFLLMTSGLWFVPLMVL